MNKQNKNYIFSFDLIRAFAILGVVAIHVFLPIYTRPDFLAGISWWFAYSVNAISRSAVPLFIMVSGALLLNKKQKNQIKDSLNRAVFRVGIPLLFWSFTYFNWELFYFERRTSLISAISTFFSADVFHLYFLIIIFNLYLFTPIFKTYIKNSSQILKKYIIFLTLLIGFLIYFLQYFVFKGKNILNFFTIWIPYLGYFLAGDYLNKLKIKSKQFYLLSLVFIISLIFTILFGYFNLKLFSQNIMTFWGMGGSEYFTQFLSLNVIIMSLLAFVLLTKTNLSKFFEKNIYLNKIIKNIAKTSFGVYLIHIIIIGLLDKYFGFAIHNIGSKLWLYGMEKMLIVFTVSWTITHIAIKIPVIKMLFGEKEKLIKY
ncbi:MAG: acyltransferase family protein [Patescibacteria group bacterium]